ISIQLNTRNARNNFNLLKSEYLKIPGVTSVSGIMSSPANGELNDAGFYLQGKNPENRTLGQINYVDPNYLNTMGIKLEQGRNLRENDSTQILINTVALKAFGIPEEEALSTKLFISPENAYDIVGVFSDFHFLSLKEPIEPLVLFNNTDPLRLLLRFETTEYGSLLPKLENIWKANVKDAPFMPSFVDKDLASLYQEEKQLGKIAVVFTILAIIISCLGLFGLISYVAEQKRKEIGIRKVLGASVKSVVQLLTTDFVRLVGIAFVIASPIAYYFMQRWLEDFTYKIDINFWVFLLAGGFALTITLVTVSFQSLKSAMANPVKSLRME
ncbi:MAG: FtsX-like permease family protein, partial [Bacteroidota bacterium]